MFNSDVCLELANPPKVESEDFYKNTDEDEVVFVHHGSDCFTRCMERSLERVII